MAWFKPLRTMLLALAAFGYLANGAQTHLHLSTGESLTLMLCGTGSAAAVEMHIPGAPPEETPETCCGDCAPPSAIVLARALPQMRIDLYTAPTPVSLINQVSPRSPLWPGAPPQGPPATLSLIS